MADIFPDRLQKDLTKLQAQFASQVDVPPERQFIGFDAYQKAMDCLKPGDIAIFATPPAFRWVHFAYAIQKGLNVFMEKPLTADGPTSKRMFSLGARGPGQEPEGRGGVDVASQPGDAGTGQARPRWRDWRDHSATGLPDARAGRIFRSLPKPAGITDLLYQVQRFHSFIWASGGCFNDFYIHLIDQLGWMKNEWPVKAQALGGRQYRSSPEGIMYVDQNFDTYSVEYTYSDGTKFFFDGRTIAGCEQIYCSYLQGTKGSGIASKAGDCGQPSSLYASQDLTAKMLWESKVKPEEQDPYQNEWNDLVDAIRDDKPYNEVQRGVEASLVSSMGRMAAHTGREVTYDQMLNCDFEMSPNTDKFTMDSPAPLVADAEADILCRNRGS